MEITEEKVRKLSEMSDMIIQANRLLSDMESQRVKLKTLRVTTRILSTASILIASVIAGITLGFITGQLITIQMVQLMTIMGALFLMCSIATIFHNNLRIQAMNQLKATLDQVDECMINSITMLHNFNIHSGIYQSR